MEPNIEKKAVLEIEQNSFFAKILDKISKKPYVDGEIDALNVEAGLIKSIREAKIEWMSANENFEQAKDPEMIDYYTYTIKACEVRYQYLLKKAKEKGIRV